MSTMKQSSELHQSLRDQRLRIDRRHFNVIFVAAWLFYLTAYSLARLLPVGLRSRLFAIERDAGVFEQARLRANLLASYATMN